MFVASLKDYFGMSWWERKSMWGIRFFRILSDSSEVQKFFSFLEGNFLECTYISKKEYLMESLPQNHSNKKKKTCWFFFLKENVSIADHMRTIPEEIVWMSHIIAFLAKKIRTISGTFQFSFHNV